MEKDEIMETVRNDVNKEVHLPDGECNVAIYKREVLPSYEGEEDDRLDMNDDKLDDIIAQHPLWKQAGIYADKGRSSKEFDRLMLDCREEKVDLILTQSISRFSWHFDDAIKRVRELKDFGVGVYFLNTGFYTLGNTSDFVLIMLTTIALEESRMKSMRLADKDGIRFKEIQADMI